MSRSTGSTRTGVSISDWTPDELNTAAVLRTRQEQAVTEILQDGASGDTLRAMVNHTSDTAEAMAIRIRNPMSPPVACDKGCNWCCYQLVRVSAPEAFRIARHLASDEMAASREAIVGRLRQLDKATRGMSSESRARIPKPCAFLGADGRCSVYAVRPLACAEFTSYDEAVCKRAKRVGPEKSAAVHEKARMLAYFAVQEGMLNGLGKALPEVDTRGLELTAAMVTILDQPDAEAAWLAGQPVMKPAHLPAGAPVTIR